MILAVDNAGGFSHRGRRIAVFADGSYEEIIYTDEVGREKKRQGKCMFDSKAGTLTLDSDKNDGYAARGINQVMPPPDLCRVEA